MSLPLVFDAKSVGGPNSGATLKLWRPAGAGPFRAVIVMHGCEGVSSHQRSWAARLVSWGYAAAIVDSFRPRGVNSTCQGGGPPRAQPRSQDAFNAAAYLRTLPDILPDHIGVIGFSHGGSATLFATLAGEVPGQPHAPVIKVYPVVHGFDFPGLPKLYADHMSGGNPEAAADSFAMTEAFLAARLKSK